MLLFAHALPLGGNVHVVHAVQYAVCTRCAPCARLFLRTYIKTVTNTIIARDLGRLCKHV